MKLLYSLFVSLLAASVSARKHRLCCCAGFNACNQFVCDDYSTQSIVNAGGGRYVRSTKSWDKDQGAPIGGLMNWMYAETRDHGDDTLLGGDEISDLCNKFRMSSRCFNPRARYWNEGLTIKGRTVETPAKLPPPVVGGG
ncbi:hypothetical protein EG328_000110, partial [Venturia inaequalis]